MAVPERLRAKVGKRKIKISLGTSDAAEAKIRQAQEQARWRARFRELDREIEEEVTVRDRGQLPRPTIAGSLTGHEQRNPADQAA